MLTFWATVPMFLFCLIDPDVRPQARVNSLRMLELGYVICNDKTIVEFKDGPNSTTEREESGSQNMFFEGTEAIRHSSRLYLTFMMNFSNPNTTENKLLIGQLVQEPGVLKISGQLLLFIFFKGLLPES